MKKSIFLATLVLTTLLTTAQVTVSTLAGDGTQGFTDGTGTAAQFYTPVEVATAMCM